MPKDTLTQVSRDLRHTHFQLGGSAPSYETAHQHQFKPSPAAPPGAATSSRTREAHFSLGAGPLRGESEMAAKFRGQSVEHRVVLTQEAKNELRSHHFGMGSDKPTYMTHHKEVYGPKQPDLNVSLDSAARVKNVRKAHFQLGTDDLVTASIAKSDFTPKTVEKVEEEKFLAEMRKDLRVSHFDVGNTPQTFVSTARKDFAGVYGPSAALNTSEKDNLRREHFVLGTAKADLMTVSKDSYTAKHEGRQELSIEKLQDLRSSHFILGQSDPSYQPTSHLVHKGPGPVAPAPGTHIAAIRQSHFALGTDLNAWKTVYHTTHQPSGPQPVEYSDGAAKARVSHIVMGGGPAIAESTSHQDYKRSISAQPNRLSPENEKSLRGHHFQLGLDPSAHYAPISKGYGVPGGQPSYLDAERKKDLQATHFQYGSENPVFVTRNSQTYANKGGSVSPERAKNTRESHFDLGENRAGTWRTTYKGTYNWIQPVPDRSYKYQIQQ